MICNQVHAAEDAAMQVIHDAMRSKRTVFGHSLRDTYVRATPLLLAIVPGGGWWLMFVQWCSQAAFKAMDRDGSGQLQAGAGGSSESSRRLSPWLQEPLPRNRRHGRAT